MGPGNEDWFSTPEQSRLWRTPQRKKPLSTPTRAEPRSEEMSWLATLGPELGHTGEAKRPTSGHAGQGPSSMQVGSNHLSSRHCSVPGSKLPEISRMSRRELLELVERWKPVPVHGPQVYLAPKGSPYNIGVRKLFLTAMIERFASNQVPEGLAK